LSWLLEGLEIHQPMRYKELRYSTMS
jgi:hypothetical protein